MDCCFNNQPNGDHWRWVWVWVWGKGLLYLCGIFMSPHVVLLVNNIDFIEVHKYIYSNMFSRVIMREEVL